MLTGETIEEKEARKRQESAKRVKMLSVVAVLCLAARFVVKDPVKPPPPDHSNAPVKILPGMLASLPASERAKLSPQLLARMMEADAKARVDQMAKADAYQPANAPPPRDVLGEKMKQEMYRYARRQRAADRKRRQFKEEQEAPMKMLVRFTNGGRLRVEEARKGPEGVTVRLPGLAATFPHRMVGAVVEHAKAAPEPVPPGKIRIKPARGITMIVDRDTARRITIARAVYDEI